MCEGKLDKCVCTALHIHCSGSNVSRLEDIYPYIQAGTESVNITYTEIMEIPANFLEELFQNDSSLNLDKLTVLDLSNNKINKIGEGAFRKLNHLKTLNLSHNKVFSSDVIPDMLSGLNSLENLMLNNVTDTFEGSQGMKKTLYQANMTKLLYLDISGNSLTLFSKSLEDFLCGNDMLKFLNMSNNKYTYMVVPSCMISLETLDLSNNDIQHLEKSETGVLESFMNLQQLRLGDNPYECDCGINATIYWLNKTPLPVDVNDIRCRTSTIEKTVGKRVVDANFTSFCEEPKLVVCFGPIALARGSLWFLYVGVAAVVIAVVFIVILVSRWRRNRQSRPTLQTSESPEYTRMA